MSRLKGRLVAQVTIEIDKEYLPGEMLPFTEIRDRFNGITPYLGDLIAETFEHTKVTVNQQYADIILEEEDGH